MTSFLAGMIFEGFGGGSLCHRWNVCLRVAPNAAALANCQQFFVWEWCQLWGTQSALGERASPIRRPWRWPCQRGWCGSASAGTYRDWPWLKSIPAANWSGKSPMKRRSLQNPSRNFGLLIREPRCLLSPIEDPARHSHSLRCFLLNIASSLSNLAAKSADISDWWVASDIWFVWPTFSETDLTSWCNPWRSCWCVLKV